MFRCFFYILFLSQHPSWTWRRPWAAWCCACCPGVPREIDGHFRRKWTDFGFDCASAVAAAADVDAAVAAESAAVGDAAEQPVDAGPDGMPDSVPPSVPSSRSSSARADRLHRPQPTSCRSTCYSVTPTDFDGTLDSLASRSMSRCCCYCSNDTPSGSTRPRLPGVG